jgi:methyl-accepting chemotaxis protein
VHAAQEGKLHERGNTARFQGVYRALVQGINDTLEAVTAPMSEAGEVLGRLAARDLTARMQGTYHGEYIKIKNALNQAMEHLDTEFSKVAVSAQHITVAAGQINSSSQALAQSASEQASTLQEVSSSLHELDSMSQQNAANAQQARSLADSARHSADTGTTGMQRLSQAIDEIHVASDKTAKIVKTIDEIAFQTTLLALNAAVEAARAGDAGRGFAVVAEEVRNLAMRSAEAAKTTAQLIEEAVRKAEDGVTLNREVLGNLGEIVTQVHKVSEVMGEIAAASEQQQQGVQQLNTAVGQLNQVTQQTTGNSEAAASAAQRLSSQAAEMQHLVSTFQLSPQRAPSSPTVRVAAALKAPRPASALPAAPGAKAGVPMLTRAAPGRSQSVAARAPLADMPYDHDEVEVLQEF